jgi:thymidylate synthase (FAD)
MKENKMIPYADMTIEVIQATEQSTTILHDACMLTTGKEIKDMKQTIQHLVSANHTSLFEHMSMTLLITNVSRSFLAQITRHRMASYTASSQHYQEYNTYPNVVSEAMAKASEVKQYCDENDAFYNYLIAMDIPKEEARQILIGAKAVNLMWTINARSLMNFLNLRLCKRNVQEMYLFAMRLHKVCYKWWPELFGLIGPDCEMLGGCTQGHMKAEVCKNAKTPNFKR